RKGFEVVVYMVSEASLKKGFEAYKELSITTERRAGVLSISAENVASYIESIRSIDDSTRVIEGILGSDDPYHVTMIIEAMLASALTLNASDVHIEPGEDSARLRFRLDGLLSDVLEFDNKTYAQLLSRLKLLSGVKINI